MPGSPGRDVEAFLRDYPLGDAAVATAIAPYAIAQVGASALRPAIDLVLRAPDRAALLVCIEARVDGAEHLAATAALHLSYYDEPGIDHAAAAAVVRRLAAALAAHEAADAGDAGRRRLPVIEGAGRALVELRINRACNERCRFCNTPEDSPTILPDADAVRAQIVAAARGGCRELLLSGRETTLEPRLVEHVAAARAAGIPTVRIQSNATTLGHGPLLGRLVDAGLAGVEVSLHTLDPDVFEALIGPRALLGHTLAGLDAIAAAPLRLNIVVVLTARNAAEAPALVDAIARRWPSVAGVTLSPVAPVGDGADALDLLMPYEQLAPLLAAALRRAAAHGIAASIPARCGLPPCTLPPDVRAAHDAVRHRRGGPIEPAKRKPPRCATCALDPICGGAWTRYLDHHGDAALVPI